MDAKDLYKYIKPLWEKANFDLSLFDHKTLMRVIDLIKERARLLTDFVDSGYYFFREFDNYDEKGVKKHFLNDYSVNYLTMLLGEIDKLDKYSPDVIENIYRKIVEERNISAGKLIHPTRLALTGKTVGPSLFHLMEFVGKNRTLDRIRKAIDFINRENN